MDDSHIFDPISSWVLGFRVPTGAGCILCLAGWCKFVGLSAVIDDIRITGKWERERGAAQTNFVASFAFDFAGMHHCVHRAKTWTFDAVWGVKFAGCTMNDDVA